MKIHLIGLAFKIYDSTLILKLTFYVGSKLYYAMLFFRDLTLALKSSWLRLWNQAIAILENAANAVLLKYTKYENLENSGKLVGGVSEAVKNEI